MWLVLIELWSETPLFIVQIEMCVVSVEDVLLGDHLVVFLDRKDLGFLMEMVNRAHEMIARYNTKCFILS